MKKLKFHLWLFTAGILGSALPGAATTITSFTATSASNSAYFSTINTAFDSNVARITNSSVTCASELGCSGAVANFTLLGSDFTTGTPIKVEIDGTYTGAGSEALAGGSVSLQFYEPSSSATALTGVPSAFTFVITQPNFDNVIVPTTPLPIPNASSFKITGTLSLSMLPGANITLPSSFAITLGTPTTTSPNATPEPGTVGLMASGLGALFMLGRRKLRKQ